jgi:hypothetical protein
MADGSCRVHYDHSLARRKIADIEGNQVNLAVEQSCFSACKVSFGSYDFIGAAQDTESPATANGRERGTAIAGHSRHRLAVADCACNRTGLRWICCGAPRAVLRQGDNRPILFGRLCKRRGG